MRENWIGRVVRFRGTSSQILQGLVIGISDQGDLMVRAPFKAGIAEVSPRRVLWWTCCLPRTRNRIQEAGRFAAAVEMAETI